MATPIGLPFLFAPMQHHPATAQQHLTPPRDHTTALASNPRNFAAAQKMLRKMLQFQENFLLLFSESK
ncbi:MAG: hypothetical protein IKW36_08635 [Alistipes sp.]|nr:hypothetical protein [Alistipes sp.]